MAINKEMLVGVLEAMAPYKYVLKLFINSRIMNMALHDIFWKKI